MKRIGFTWGLAWLTCWIFLALPLLTLQVFCLRGLEKHTFFWVLGGAFILAIIIWQILSFKQVALSFFTLMAVIWLALSLWYMFLKHSLVLAAITLGVVFYDMVSIFLIQRMRLRAPFRPRCAWHETYPAAMPYLEASWNGELYRVSSFDASGVFLFRHEYGAPLAVGELKLTFHEQSMYMRGRILTHLDRCHGVGILFTEVDADRIKACADFLEKLRGRGYVQVT